MDIRFYDFEFSRLAEFPRPLSVNIEECYCGFGSAEVHFSLENSEVIDVLEGNSHLFFVAEGHSAIVTGWQVGEDIAIFGRTPQWLLTKRVVMPFSLTSATAEEIAIYAVGSAEDFVETASALPGGTVTNFSTDNPATIYDTVCNVLLLAGLGFLVEPDIPGKRFVFSVYQGERREYLLSTSVRTAYDIEYTVDKQDEVSSCGWYKRKIEYKGDWDAIENEPVLRNNQSENAFTCYKITSNSYKTSGAQVERFGLWCQKDHYIVADNEEGSWTTIALDKPSEAWIYYNGGEASGLYKWEALLNGTKTAQEAASEISLMKAQNSVSSQTVRAKYGDDYRLGDIIRVQYELGNIKKSEEKRVTSVSVYYDADGSGVTPTLERLEE